MTRQFAVEPLTMDEVDKLENVCETFQEKLIVWTFLDTGLRLNEMANLTTDNILWQEKVIRVKGKGGPFGKMSKIRTIPLSTRVYALLSHHFAVNNKWICSSRQIARIVKNVAEKARIMKKVAPHVLRHTFATLALQKGISLAAVQKILGHDRLSTTAIYLNLTDKHVLDEFEKKW